jgi:hypothetical protein
VFTDNALRQYTRELTFAQCVGLMSDVVFRIVPSVGAWYKAHQDEVPVTRQAVYDKLKHLELPTAAGLVEYAGRELGACLQQMPSPPSPLLPGYRVRVLDGNHLAGTEHRVKALRHYRAAALPGHALVFYDPQWEVATDVIPCEDAYAQERSLLPEVVPMVTQQDCLVADRNFCTLGFLFGIARRDAFFVIRHHGSNVVGQPQGPRRGVGHDARGQALYEQTMCLTEPDTSKTLVVRRITVQLLTPTRDGETELHILTNLPAADAPAAQISALYADRWTIETAFQHLTVDLACEVDTLGYPKAALFGFCVALSRQCGGARQRRTPRRARGSVRAGPALHVLLDLGSGASRHRYGDRVGSRTMVDFSADEHRRIYDHPRGDCPAARHQKIHQTQTRPQETTPEKAQREASDACIDCTYSCDARAIRPLQGWADIPTNLCRSL